MYFKTFYWNLLGPFASLYAFFLVRFLLIYFKDKTKYHFKLALLALNSFLLASIVGLMLGQKEPLNLHVFTFSSFVSYSGHYIYFNLISRRFGYRDRLSKTLEAALKGVALCVFGALITGIIADISWIYYKTEELPSNLFLASTIGGHQLTLIPKLISLCGTIAVCVANLYLLKRFFRQRLVGYQKLIWWGVITSLIVKVTDFTLTAGVGTYLIPLGFVNFLFEIIYFHFQYDKNGELALG